MSQCSSWWCASIKSVFGGSVLIPGSPSAPWTASRIVNTVDDLLGVTSQHQITAAATPLDDPLPLVRSSETLTTNLLAVKAFAPVIYSAEADIADRQEAWATMTAAGQFESGFTLWRNQLYSFVPLTGALLLFARVPRSHSQPQNGKSQRIVTCTVVSSLF